jgi:hypothetical protein
MRIVASAPAMSVIMVIAKNALGKHLMDANLLFYYVVITKMRPKNARNAFLKED